MVRYPQGTVRKNQVFTSLRRRTDKVFSVQRVPMVDEYKGGGGRSNVKVVNHILTWRVTCQSRSAPTPGRDIFDRS